MLAVAALGACAAPSRRLSPRVVNDPIVLPRRMASVSLGAQKTWYPRDGTSAFGITPTFAVGLTDRLEYQGLVGVGYAILDDAPGSPRAPSPLSLAVEAGILGVGYSSSQGLIVDPVVGIRVQKHVADRWNLSLLTAWYAAWYERPAAPSPNPSLSALAFGRNRSEVDISVHVTRQLGERFALALGATPYQVQDCLAPFCSWTIRGVGGSLILWFRPADWITLGLGPNGGVRYRPPMLPEPTDPSEPVVSTPPRSVPWLGVFGSVVYYW
jgi:hypothetical protein